MIFTIPLEMGTSLTSREFITIWQRHQEVKLKGKKEEIKMKKREGYGG